MRHTPRWLKIVAIVSLAAEATAAAAVFWQLALTEAQAHGQPSSALTNAGEAAVASIRSKCSAA